MLCLSTAPAFAEPFGPWGVVHGGFSSAERACPARTRVTGATRTTRLVLLGGVMFYRRYLSPLKGFHCPSTPICSGFAMTSVSRYGVLQGLLMTLDRLFIREHSGMGAFYPLVRRRGLVRYHDPPERNDLTSPLPFPRDFVDLDARW